MFKTMGFFAAHGFSIFFALIGLALIAVGLNDGWMAQFDQGAVCADGSRNCTSDAKGVFLFVGVVFVAAAVLVSVVMEFVRRRLGRWARRINTADPASIASIEDLSGFLKPFGIDLDEAVVSGSPGGATIRDRTNTVSREGVITEVAGAEVTDLLAKHGVSIGESGGPAAGHVNATRGETVRELATIRHITDRGETAGEQRLLELTLDVAPATSAAYSVTVASLVRSSLAGLLRPGSTLSIRVAKHDKEAVTIDWSEN